MKGLIGFISIIFLIALTSGVILRYKRCDLKEIVRNEAADSLMVTYDYRDSLLMEENLEKNCYIYSTSDFK
jgi:hypothetical protein